MALAAVQLTLSTSEQAAIVQGAGAGQFKNVAGVVGDPLPCVISNQDAAIIIFVGGPGVTALTGLAIQPKTNLTLNLYGSSEIPHLVAASGTPIAGVLLGRQ